MQCALLAPQGKLHSFWPKHFFHFHRDFGLLGPWTCAVPALDLANTAGALPPKKVFLMPRFADKYSVLCM
tara:strand:+ start:60 stop:269 length:210 start_codon:yes stop_codon:yes gene_type:complete